MAASIQFLRPKVGAISLVNVEMKEKKAGSGMLPALYAST
jgi:hypothetical protein